MKGLKRHWFIFLDVSQEKNGETPQSKDVLLLLKQELGAEEIPIEDLPKGVLKNLTRREVIKATFK